MSAVSRTERFPDRSCNELREAVVSLIQRSGHWKTLDAFGLPQKGPVGHIEAIVDAMVVELVERGESELDLLNLLRMAYRLTD